VRRALYRPWAITCGFALHCDELNFSKYLFGGYAPPRGDN
jgi:hypothetical protein